MAKSLFNVNIDGIKYKYDSTLGNKTNDSIGDFSGKLIRLEDEQEAEVGVPVIYNTYPFRNIFTTINDYQYQGIMEAKLNSSSSATTITITRQIYTAHSLQYYNETFIPKGVLVVTSTNNLTGDVYSVQDASVPIDKAPISGTEYREALNTAKEISGKEVAE